MYLTESGAMAMPLVAVATKEVKATDRASTTERIPTPVGLVAPSLAIQKVVILTKTG